MMYHQRRSPAAGAVWLLLLALLAVAMLASGHLWMVAIGAAVAFYLWRRVSAR